MANLERKFVGLRGILPALILGTTLLFPLSVHGAEQTAEQPQPTGIFASMDAPRDYLSEKIIGFATDMDRFFGNDRNYQETNNSVVQLDLARTTGYGGDRKLVLSARANLNLPSTEKRLHLLIESNPDQNFSGEPTTTQNTAINNQVSGPQSYGLALRYEKVKEEMRALHISADAGLKFQGIHVDPFMRARTSYSIPFDTWRMKAAESVYWFNTIGLGETTQVDFEHVVSEPVLFRATSNATWLKDKQNFDLRQDFSLYQTLNDRTALLYQASAIGVSNPQVELTEYIAQILYRYRLHRQWMFFELNPQLIFPKVNNFRSSFALTMRLEILFDRSR